jgi:hypothetical protein
MKSSQHVGLSLILTTLIGCGGGGSSDGVDIIVAPPPLLLSV